MEENFLVFEWGFWWDDRKDEDVEKWNFLLDFDSEAKALAFVRSTLNNDSTRTFKIERVFGTLNF